MRRASNPHADWSTPALHQFRWAHHLHDNNTRVIYEAAAEVTNSSCFVQQPSRLSSYEGFGNSDLLDYYYYYYYAKWNSQGRDCKMSGTRRGLVAPQNTFLEKIIRRCNGQRKYYYLKYTFCFLNYCTLQLPLILIKAKAISCRELSNNIWKYFHLISLSYDKSFWKYIYSDWL